MLLKYLRSRLRKFMNKLAYIISNLSGMPKFLYDYVHVRGRLKKRFSIGIKSWLPILTDSKGVMAYDSHYVYHSAWALRMLEKYNIQNHVDISSSLMFCAMASANIKISHYDFRIPSIELSNLTVGKQNLTKLTFENCSIDSLSCMHVIEHIGLGRYGDPLNPDGDLEAANELARVLSKGGLLFLVVPVGKDSVVRFNAHRIYSYEAVLEMFETLSLESFSFVNDDGTPPRLTMNASKASTVSSNYGCGCFIFRKP
jgi:hypothetical protein